MEDSDKEKKIEVDFETGAIHYKQQDNKDEFVFSDDHFSYSEKYFNSKSESESQIAVDEVYHQSNQYVKFK